MGLILNMHLLLKLFANSENFSDGGVYVKLISIFMQYLCF